MPLSGLLAALLILFSLWTWLSGGRPTPPPPPAPAPVPVPTATPDLAQRETMARALLDGSLGRQADGDYETAAAGYQAILSLYADTSAGAAALFRLGECHLLLGENQLAWSAFQRVRRDYPTAEWSPQATFLAGTAAQQLGDREGAISLYQEYARQRPLLRGYVALRIGDLQREGKHLPEALAAYEAALTADLPHVPAMDILQRIAEVHTEQGAHAKSIARYEEILTRARTASYRSLILYRLGMAQREAGQMAKARNALLQVINDYPDSGSALPSLEALDKMGGEGPGDFQRALVYFHAQKYAESIAVWRRYVSAAPFGEGTARARFYIGLAYQRQGEYRQAAAEFDTLIRLYPKGSLLADARLEKARGFQFSGDAAAAAQEYLTVALYYPHTPQAERGLWEGGLAHYRLGDPAGATAAWQELVSAYPQSQFRTQALFWLGKALLAQGKTAEGRRYLAEVAAASPPGHYAMRAAELLADTLPLPGRGQDGGGNPPTGVQPGSGDEGALESWLAAWAAASPPTEGAKERVLSEPHLARGRELLAIHLWDEASDEFSLATESLGHDPWALLAMILLLRESSQYRHTIGAAQQLLSISPIPRVGDAPVAVQRLLYPAGYRPLVEDAAKKQGLDPLWLLALVRQESLFNARAISWAEARGLTQVIPATARMIAERLDRAGFRPEDLYRPRLSLEFGAYYLAEMLRLTQGDVWMALAAYNGGYSNARRWAGGERVSDRDLFLENIAFGETQAFVRQVYQGYQFYKRLYGDAPP